jgi:hypothetical protein
MKDVIDLGSFDEVIDFLGAKIRKERPWVEVKYFHTPII